MPYVTGFAKSVPNTQELKSILLLNFKPTYTLALP